MKRLFVLIISILCLGSALAQPSPKHEFRGVWLSTVANIDWPKNPKDTDEKKMDDLRQSIKEIYEMGANAVVFQVRPACDAMYKSELEPWSYWFTGEQGTAPEANWDPLEFAIKEAHKYGMELHAWVNPYRAVKDPTKVDSSFYISEKSVAKQHPEWILMFKSVGILDPGLKDVRTYIQSVLMDIVTRYDIDGLHMDDYFYPYEQITGQDSATYTDDTRGIENIHDWRRDNINLLVTAMADSINKTKPWVKWGISPFGIYKPNQPEGIKGFNAWAVLYCDPIAWLEDGTVDYITPQCYWPFGGGQDYGKLIPYWAELAKKYKRHFYPGQALYRAGTDKFPDGEIMDQIRLNRATKYCDGSVFFTAHNIAENPKGSTDSLKMDLYKNKALWPIMEHKQHETHHAVSGVELKGKRNGRLLTWETDEDDWGYVVYRSKSPLGLFSDPVNIQEVMTDKEGVWFDHADGSWFYAVSSLDNYKVESYPVQPEYDFVTPRSPENEKMLKGKSVCFKWTGVKKAQAYHIQVAEDSEFNTMVYQERYVSGKRLRHSLPKGKTYYWRVMSDMTGQWSPVWTFKISL